MIKKAQFKFNALITLIKSIKEMKSIFYQNRIYLKNGKYHYNIFGKHCVYNNNEASKQFVEKITKHRISNRSFAMSLLSFTINLFSRLHVANEGSELHLGDILMITIDDDIKIFNFDKSLIITKVNEKSDIKLLKSNTDYFKNFFSLTIIDYDLENSIIIDKLIDYKPYNLWTESEKMRVIGSVFRGSKNHVDSVNLRNIEQKSTIEFLTLTKEFVHWASIYEFISTELNSYFKEITWPLVKCHGDLNFNNTLFTGSEVFIIDWDNSTKAVFFYDIMNLLFVDALYLNDYSYLVQYFDGKFDVWMKEFFGLFSLPFINKYKKDYIFVYILNRIIYYENVSNVENYQFLVPKYKKVLDYIVEMH